MANQKKLNESEFFTAKLRLKKKKTHKKISYKMETYYIKIFTEQLIELSLRISDKR